MVGSVSANSSVTILVIDLFLYEVPVISASLLMAFLACAQGLLLSKEPFHEVCAIGFVPLLSLFIAGFHSGLI